MQRIPAHHERLMTLAKRDRPIPSSTDYAARAGESTLSGDSEAFRPPLPAAAFVAMLARATRSLRPSLSLGRNASPFGVSVTDLVYAGDRWAFIRTSFVKRARERLPREPAK